MKIEVYTDGSATTRDKPGGWAWVMVLDGIKWSEGSGSIPNATNNDAELQAAIMGLGYCLKHLNSTDPVVGTDTEITLCSDSQIVLGWTNGTYRFKQSAKREKFAQLQFLANRLNVKTRWVEGHAGHEHNERCDKLAREERRKAMGIVPKKRVKKKFAIEHEKLYDMCYEAKKHADTSDGKISQLSNDWMTMFADSLKEQLEK